MRGEYNINSVLLYSEINILCIVIMLIIAVNLSVSGYDKSRRNRMLSYSVYLATAANAFDFIWNLCLSGTVRLPAALRYATDYCYFIVFGMSALCWLIYTDIIQKNSILKDKKLMAVYLIPLFVLAVLLFVNSFNGCLFYIDGNGNYYRGELFYAQQALSYSYIIISTVKCFLKATHRSNFAQRDYFLNLSTFVIPPVICGIIQIIIQDIPILSVGIVISFLLAYISSLKRLILLDPLTGISNRRDFLQCLADELKSLKLREDLYFLFIDVDNFKLINDTFGHNEGDRILREIAAVLKKFTKNANSFCSRYGGDEFAVYVVTECSADIKEICRSFERFLEEKHIILNSGDPVTVSMGYSRYLGDDDSIQEMIFRADEAMYNAKKAK